MIKKFLNILNKQFVFGLVTGILVVGLIGAVTYSTVIKKQRSGWLSVAEAEAKSTQYINAELLGGKGSATVKVTGEEGNLYKLEVKYNGQSIDSYITKDGKKLFPQAFEMAVNSESGKTNNAETTVNEVAKKSDKPAVELFVMSHCPYGTQIEKGIIPVVEKLGNNIDFQIKFVSYTMHGEKEIKEQLNQYCIQKEQNPKYLGYLKCFLKAGDSENCLSQSGIDQTKLSSCVDKTDNTYKVLANFKSKTGYNGSYPGFDVFKADNEKYNVAGSPTLVINETQSESGRDSNSLLKTICSSFNSPPRECQDSLSDTTPTPGFGEGSQSGSSGSGGCNN